MTNEQITTVLRENDALLNVYVNEGMYISRVVKNNDEKTVMAIASRPTLEQSVQRAITSIK